jgi:DNA invertase Pin-like site-specific DNA recombinase
MRCAVYTRFSSDSQHPASIDDQLLACRRYAAQQGWRIFPEHEYADEALSGVGVEHRPAYRRLLAALGGTPPFEVLLVDDLSRLSRDAAEILRLVRLLQGLGVKLISVADGIETGHKLSKLVVSMKAVINELYLDDLRDRTLRGLHGRFARGLHTGGRIYGYRAVPMVDPSGRTDATGQPLVLGTALAVEPAEAQTVRQIFEWFAGGVSLRAIAHRLNAEQVPFPAEPTRRGGKRKGWASSAVRVILLNEKYVGRWVYGRRMFVKDPLTGRRTARLRPLAEWQVTEHPSLRLIEPSVSETVQAKFQRLAASYPRSRGRLAGRAAGSPSGRPSLFSGVLQCVCGGTLVVVSGDPRRAERRYGCGFHREKGPQVCANALTIKVDTVERRLLEAIRVKLLNPEAVRYLITAVNRHLDTFRGAEDAARGRLEQELGRVEEELRNVERAILAGVVSETTAALVQDREAQRRALKERLVAQEFRRGTGPLRVDAAAITAQLARLNELLGRDVARANAYFRAHVAPIICAPVREAGRKFYRATVAAKGAEIVKSLGLAPQAFDFGGCGGWI